MTRPTDPATLLALAAIAFVSLGLPDAVLGVAWPSLRDGFRLPQAALGAPLAASVAAYFASGLLAGRLVQRLGIGKLLAWSTALVAAGVLGSSVAPAFPAFVLAAPIVGFGSGAIDAALNGYAARHFTPKHMSWLHAAYAAGAMGGPAVMTAVLARGAPWRAGYAAVGAALAALAAGFHCTRRVWDRGPGGGAPADAAAKARAVRGDGLGDGPALDGPGGGRAARRDGPPMGALAALRCAPVRLQIAIFFLYTGLESTAGQWSYTVLTEARGVGGTAAGAWTAAYWGGLLAGRLLLGYAMEQLGPVTTVRLATGGALVAAALFAIPGVQAGAPALPLLSFSLAPIYPGLMSETPRRVGARAAPHAVGFQVSAATLGVAVVPSLAGLVGQRFGLEAIGVLLVACALLLVVLGEVLVARGGARG